MIFKIGLFVCFLAVFGLAESSCVSLYRPKMALPMVAMPALPAMGLSMALPMGYPCEPASDCGPQPSPLPIIQAPPVTTPTLTGPIIPLPSPPIPCPKTIAHRCVCTKTVVKPQLIQRCITVPTVQRYLKRTYTPVVENIAYKAKPKCPPCALAAKVPAAPIAVPPPLPLALPYSRIC